MYVILLEKNVCYQDLFLLKMIQVCFDIHKIILLTTMLEVHDGDPQKFL